VCGVHCVVAEGSRGWVVNPGQEDNIYIYIYIGVSPM